VCGVLHQLPMAIVQSLPHLQVQMYGSAVASATSTYGGGDTS